MVRTKKKQLMKPVKPVSTKKAYDRMAMYPKKMAALATVA